MIGERYVVELRRVSGEEATSNFMSDPAERIVAVRVPDVEQIAPTGSEHPIDFLIGFGLVREEHHAKLAYDRIEGAVWERQGHGIGRAQVHLFARLELCPRHLDHRWIEVGRRQLRVSGQDITQLTRDNPSTGGRLQHTRHRAGSHSSGHIGRIVDEDDGSQTSIVVVRDIAYEACCIAGHQHSPHQTRYATGKGDAPSYRVPAVGNRVVARKLDFDTSRR